MLAFAVAVIVSLALGGKGSTGGPCQQMIAYIRAGNANSSYGLLTANAQALTPKTGWSEQVAGLRLSFRGETVPQLKASTFVADQPKNELQSTYNETYIVTSGASKYLATCILTLQTDKKTYRIDGFTSTPDLDMNDYKKTKTGK